PSPGPLMRPSGRCTVRFAACAARSRRPSVAVPTIRSIPAPLGLESHTENLDAAGPPAAVTGTEAVALVCPGSKETEPDAAEASLVPDPRFVEESTVAGGA